MGFEGANVLFDTWVHPLMMGLEEHLLGMFREDFEFHDGAAPSHLGKTGATPERSSPTDNVVALTPDAPSWTEEAEQALGKVPFFVRGKARRNTEHFAQERGIGTITVDTLYDAKSHFSS